jgi:hypothetical protein
MRTDEEICTDAADKAPFPNLSEYEIWADSGKGCFTCAHNDDATTGWFCPVLSVALLSRWPREWTRVTRQWSSGGESGSYEMVDECTEFEQQRSTAPVPTNPEDEVSE